MWKSKSGLSRNVNLVRFCSWNVLWKIYHGLWCLSTSSFSSTSMLPCCYSLTDFWLLWRAWTRTPRSSQVSSPILNCGMSLLVTTNNCATFCQYWFSITFQSRLIFLLLWELTYFYKGGMYQKCRFLNTSFLDVIRLLSYHHFFPPNDPFRFEIVRCMKFINSSGVAQVFALQKLRSKIQFNLFKVVQSKFFPIPTGYIKFYLETIALHWRNKKRNNQHFSSED